MSEKYNMEKFNNLRSIPSYLSLQNIDTDMIIPKQFLKTIKRTGLGKSLFYEMRYDENGKSNDNFILNREPYDKSKILLAGKNFGCGSSREHAPWALSDFGIKCVISASFADIFYNNCFKNGILPIILPKKERDLLMDDALKGSNSILTVNLENQEIKRPDGSIITFDVDQFKKKCLLNGLDDIELTMKKLDRIKSFEDSYFLKFPWLGQ
jgi:3-isopropylmalate/(R)-2-methylmalate dehydratase small subunit